MARYWAYIGDHVMGPYELEQLIRLPGFSRQTMVSIDDYSGGAGSWISPAAIPELARIFQKVDELNESPPAPSRPVPRPPKRVIPRPATAPAPVQEAKSSSLWVWGLLLLSALVAGGLFQWNRVAQRAQGIEDRKTAQALIEMAPLPSKSLYSTLRQYLQTHHPATRWEFQRLPTGLYNVALSWLSPDRGGASFPVYSFEVNLQVESVRGLNTAAVRLLAEGFPAPPRKEPVAPKSPPRSPEDTFPAAINDRRQAVEQGDFESVWRAFSRHRKSDMEQGGISSSGFVRMQNLTYRLSPGLRQTILKTRPDTAGVQLVLVRQTQPKHPDIYIKQRWVWEDNQWRLDEEEKKVAAPPSLSGSDKEEPPSPQNAPPPEPRSPASPAPRPIPPNLPGLSDPASAPR